MADAISLIIDINDESDQDHDQDNSVNTDISNDEKAIQLIVDSLASLLTIERKILENASAINDEGTSSMMSDFIVEQEKTIWMMQAWLA